MNRRSFIGRVIGLLAVGPLAAWARPIPVTPTFPSDLVIGSSLFSGSGQLLARTTFPEPIICKQGDTLETVIEWTFQ